MNALTLAITQLPHAEGLPLPGYQSAEAAGFDLAAAVAEDSPVTLPPGGRALIPTGLVFELPPGTEAQVRPRSGLALSAGITVLNSPGTIDSDYRGEVKVILVNLGSEAFAPVTQLRIVPALEIRETGRGSGGFGSTGV
ncbi:MAG: dUTP diphosphatase [Beijerinckiaceae bacterium]|nr:dUTP diphosphatase [Beijerinckiaceae bacterium]